MYRGQWTTAQGVWVGCLHFAGSRVRRAPWCAMPVKIQTCRYPHHPPRACAAPCPRVVPAACVPPCARATAAPPPSAAPSPPLPWAARSPPPPSSAPPCPLHPHPPLRLRAPPPPAATCMHSSSNASTGSGASGLCSRNVRYALHERHCPTCQAARQPGQRAGGQRVGVRPSRGRWRLAGRQSYAKLPYTAAAHGSRWHAMPRYPGPAGQQA